MSDFKGTPGPWEAVKISRDEELKVIVKGSLKKSPGMRIYTAITDEIENKHNAKLIAAAPELLDLVQRANGKNGCHTVAWQEKAKEILSKALGQ